MKLAEKKANLKDVAERAGVSLTTASLVLNNRPSIGEETRQRVWKAKKELGYEPNLYARNLRKRSSSVFCTYNVGLAVIEARPNDPVDIPLIKTFCREVQKTSYCPVLLHIPCGINLERNLPPVLRERNLDGYILTGVLTKDNIAFFASLNIPFVIWGCYDVGPEISIVKPDLIEGVIRGMNYLFSLGHEKIGLISEILSYDFHKEVLRGYREAYQRRGLELREEWIQQSGETLEGGYKPTEAILKLQDVPSALFVIDHRTACGVIQTLQRHGITAGRDMSVLALSAVEHSSFRPRITQIKSDTDTTRKLLVKILFEKITDPQQPSLKVAVPCMLEEGETCGPKREEVMPISDW